MPTSMFLAYLEEIPRLRAEQLLDAASAAHPTETWFDAQIALLKDRHDDNAPLNAGPTPFRLKLSDPQGTGNYVGPVTPRGLHQRITALQDGGYG